MTNTWTFGRKVAAGYAVMVALCIVLGAIAVYALNAVVANKDRVIDVNAQILLDTQRLLTLSERRVASVRGYMISREQGAVDELREARTEFVRVLSRLRSHVDSQEELRLLQAIEQSSVTYTETADEAIALSRTQTQPQAIERYFEETMLPAHRSFAAAIHSFVDFHERLLANSKRAASEAASSAGLLVACVAAIGAVFALIVALVLTRSLSRQIGTAVGHVQSSSSELQAAATQQASGAKEQASAMTEITTTISEFVATSRQIAESAQRVAQIAQQTASAARHGEGTVDNGQNSIVGIRKQVDTVVNHMLDLGRKSQEIGAVLDIVSELAEQTNILAINATIEATGAGETGRRFAVVADEIRKLADRVTNSTKEIRALIDDVRGAVNTTVLATESSAKAVEEGSRQFTEVAVAFKQIADLVGTTMEAAREIELSTKQQATAAEQVRVAVSDVAQTTHESEASTGQTLQTASQLAGLSRDLLRLIQPRAATA